jgi:hypothetical protein
MTFPSPSEAQVRETRESVRTESAGRVLGMEHTETFRTIANDEAFSFRFYAPDSCLAAALGQGRRNQILVWFDPGHGEWWVMDSSRVARTADEYRRERQ